MIKVAVIGSNGLPGRYGGWEQLLEHLTFHLKGKFQLYVYTSSYSAVKGLKEYNGAKLKIIPLKANGIQSILYDGISMFHSVFYCDLMLVLGTSGCLFLPIVKLSRKKILLNPDGAEWKRGKWNILAKWFLKISEDLGMRYADTVIADNKVIQDYIFNTYKIKSELIEYGGDNAIAVPMTFETENKYGISKEQYAFKVCRIEPENNIDLILETFQNLNFKLVLVGNWEFSNYGSNLRKKYSIFNNLILLDPIYHQETLNELRSNCKMYIHGHSVGGTNPSLVEAMNLGLCCLVFDVDYNRETTENKAIYFKDSAELSFSVEKVINNEIENILIRNEMLKIGKNRYTWDIIIDKYKSLFTY